MSDTSSASTSPTADSASGNSVNAQPSTLHRYEEKKQRLTTALRSNDPAPVRLDKSTSNLFRDRNEPEGPKLSVREFNTVLHVDSSKGWVDVEGMTTYEDLVDATLRHQVMPTVVPELKSITIGGAAAGVGIESSSFKYGLVHETLLEMEVLVANGRVLTCTPDNEHRDLFFGFPNSYGTLGYALKLRVRTVPTRPYVKLQHIRYEDPTAYFMDLESWCDKNVDFIDGVVFRPNEMYLTLGSFVDDAPHTSDYTLHNIYYQSIREKETDYLTVHDYIWRWDTDWFWCSKNLYAQHPLVRSVLGKSFLNSVTYTKIMRWNSKWGLTKRLNRLRGLHSESVIQDVDIPVANAPAFLEFFQEQIGIRPIWICPIRAYQSNARFDLFPMKAGTVYVNFGFWDVVRSRVKHSRGHYNSQVEREVKRLGGIKSLYSDSYYSPEDFWAIYDSTAYEQLKAKYDPRGKFKNLYQKCVLKA